MSVNLTQLQREIPAAPNEKSTRGPATGSGNSNQEETIVRRLQGSAVQLADVDPWQEAVNGGDVLDAAAKQFANYVVLPDGAADVLALWCAHAHVFKVFQCSPRLHVCSPEKGCGKPHCAMS
jgi:hypothetical protein